MPGTGTTALAEVSGNSKDALNTRHPASSQCSKISPLILKMVVPGRSKDERESCYARSDDPVLTAGDPTLRDASHTLKSLFLVALVVGSDQLYPVFHRLYPLLGRGGWRASRFFPPYEEEEGLNRLVTAVWVSRCFDLRRRWHPSVFAAGLPERISAAGTAS